MASYSYKCNKCEKEFDIYKGMNEVVDVVCECGSEDVSRVYGVPIASVWKCSGAFGKSK